MTQRDQIQMSLELATAISEVGEAQAALDRFTDLARIHHLDCRSNLYFAGYHLREVAAILTKVGVGSIDPSSPVRVGPLAAQAPAEQPAPIDISPAPSADNISSPCGEGKGEGESLSEIENSNLNSQI